ncbi:MAG TPA: hypothetical protein VMH89_00575 [Candidatus Acidoferrum sp.]|nr:hypothetical protein [Candidatus Acidoferrum sp.]
MDTNNLSMKCLQCALKILLASAFFAFVLIPKASAQSDEFDDYKIRLEGFWVYSYPSGTFQGTSDTVPVDLQRDLSFGSYTTGVGKLDWKFTHKNHLYVGGGPFNSSHQTVLNRTIVFQGQTFEVGTQIQASLSSPVFIFGYQYDIIRRRRGHLGLAAQIDVFDTHAAIHAVGQVTGPGGSNTAAVSASGSLIAPIPVAGPEFRFYLTNSPRLYLEGNVYGMYFFGYGNFVSSYGDLGITLAKHVSVNLGYQLGTRLVVNNDSSNNRIGLYMTQKGPMAGLEFSF